LRVNKTVCLVCSQRNESKMSAKTGGNEVAASNKPIKRTPIDGGTAGVVGVRAVTPVAVLNAVVLARGLHERSIQGEVSLAARADKHVSWPAADMATQRPLPARETILFPSDRSPHRGRG